MVKNVYIHIPFCKSKCNYCSFVSFPELTRKDEFLNALKKEIKYYYKGEKLNTLYFGGGTPSLLNVEDFKDLIGLFNTDEKTEITSELNPETLAKDYLQKIREFGINRISLGSQTFDDDILKLIGRRHDSKSIKNAIHNAKAVGFDNISIDLIYGLPTQTIEGFENDLKKAVDLDIQHVSLYGLKIDEGCYFHSHMPVNLPDEDTQADMYLKAIETLSKNYFEHYEISNFSKKGFNSKHNLNYWDNNTYHGFGIAAHGYTNGMRYANICNLDEYINNPIKHESENILSNQEKLEEEIFLGFRKMNGIDISIINNKYNIDFEKKYFDVINKYIELRHLIKTNEGYKLSIDGVLLSNEILSEFIQ